jgi:parallel beta-helix repeat protein
MAPELFMFHTDRTPVRPKSSDRVSRRPAPVVEPLEGRLLLTTYYVATNGSNLNNGTSVNTPYATLQNAVNKTVAGDTVYVRGGTYREGNGQANGTEGVRISASHGGTAGNYVTIAAYNNEVPIFKGSDVVTGWTQTTLSNGQTGWYVPWTINSQQVFVNGTPLAQVGMPSQFYTTDFNSVTNSVGHYPSPVGGVNGNQNNMAAGQFYYNASQQRLYITTNPTGATVEVSKRIRTLFSDASYIKLNGLTFMHSNYASISNLGTMVFPGANAWVENCTFTYADAVGVHVTSNSTYINNIASNNGLNGFAGAGSNYLVRSNLVTGNNYRHFGTQWAAAGIKIIPDASGIIENNEVAFNYGSGIWSDWNDSGNPFIVRGNYIHDNSPDEAGIFFEASSNGLIYNNVIVNSNRRGIYVSGSANVKVYNNTIVGQTGLSGIEVLARSGVNSTYTIVKNNTISGGTSTRDLYMSTGTGNTSDYNNFFRSGSPSLKLAYNGTTYTSLSSWRTATGFDTNSINVTPAFATPSGSNYRLLSTSPLVNAGTTLSEVALDYAGTARPVGSAYDIGAYEYVDSIAPTVVSVQIGDGTAQRSTVRKVTIVFSEKVNLNSGLGIRDGNGALVPNLTATASNPSADQLTWQLTFSGTAVTGINGSLPDGIYTILATTAVKDLAGNSLASNYTSPKFHRLYGDSDGNKAVDALDLFRFRQSYLSHTGDSNFNAVFDSDGNGAIDALDLFRFRSNYLTSYSY